MGKRLKEGGGKKYLCFLATVLKLDSLLQNLQFEELCLFSPAKQRLKQNMIIPGIFIEKIHQEEELMKNKQHKNKWE